jgi:hypothetical protein
VSAFKTQLYAANDTSVGPYRRVIAGMWPPSNPPLPWNEGVAAMGPVPPCDSEEAKAAAKDKRLVPLRNDAWKRRSHLVCARDAVKKGHVYPRREVHAAALIVPSADGGNIVTHFNPLVRFAGGASLHDLPSSDSADPLTLKQRQALASTLAAAIRPFEQQAATVPRPADFTFASTDFTEEEKESILFAWGPYPKTMEISNLMTMLRSGQEKPQRSQTRISVDSNCTSRQQQTRKMSLQMAWSLSS